MQIGDGVMPSGQGFGIQGRLGGDVELLDEKAIGGDGGGLGQGLVAQLLDLQAQAAVQPAASGEHDPNRQHPLVEPGVRRLGQLAQRLPEAPHHVVQVGTVGDVDLEAVPADHVEDQLLQGDPPFVDLDQQRALGACLADVASLQHPRECDRAALCAALALSQDLVLVDVAQGPVIVALGLQLGESAGRIVGVAGVALERGVEQPDVDPVGHGIGIVEGDVLRQVRPIEAPAVQGRAQLVDQQGFGPVVGEDVHGLGKAQRLGDPAFGIVVAAHQGDPHAGFFQPSHLGDEEQPGPDVRPITVPDIPGQDQQRNAVRDRGVDQLGEGLAGGAANALERGGLVGGQPTQGAVEV